MKACITGANSGIGLAIYNLFLERGYDIETYKRSKDIDLNISIEPFISDSFDVYINNAHQGFQQVELLYKLWELNCKRDCIIVNIGSVSSDGNKDYLNKYAIEKNALEKSCKQLQLIDSNARVVLLKLGRVNTSMVSHINNVPKLEAEEVAKYVSWVIDQPQNIVIKNLTIDLKNSRQPIT